jgi:ABC-2 type transport system ATP-binding protein
VSVPAEQVPAIEVRGLTQRFGEHVAVDRLDLTVAAGECFGLLGPNGAGKTTTIRLLVTLLPVTDGEVAIFGLDVRRKAMAVRRLLGYVPQQLSVEGALTGRENVSWFARLFDVPRRERTARVDEVLTMMDLTDAADRLASTYSGGRVRRLELAQALVNRPALLVLDEPTVGLDPEQRLDFRELLRDLGVDSCVLVSTHLVEDVVAACTDVVMMNEGRLVFQGTPNDLIAQGSETDAGDSPAERGYSALLRRYRAEAAR